ncbi:MAG: sialidase family protein [Pyrinomonadaceae bacterium]
MNVKLRTFRSLIVTFAFLLLVAQISISGQAEPFFEEGTIVQPGKKGQRHAYPVASRTANGNIITIWSLRPGNHAKNKLVGAVSKDDGKTWSAPFEVLDIPERDDGDPALIIDGDRILVYSTTVTPPNKITKADIFMVESRDEGESWTKPIEIKTPYNYFIGKRHVGIKLRNGDLLLPSAYDIWAQEGWVPARTEGEMDMKAGIMLSKDGVNWTPHIDIHVLAQKISPFATNGATEPAVVELQSGELYMLVRTGTGFFYESRSKDGGKTWSKAIPSPLVGHNTPASLWRLDQDPKEIIAIWNNSPRFRNPLSVAISADGGHTWSKPKNVANAGPLKNHSDLQNSYPGITQDKEGNFVAVWQSELPNGEGREIRWARFNRAWVLSK